MPEAREVKAQEFVWAVYTAWIEDLVMITKDETWRADDPVVKRHPECFTAAAPDSITDRSGVAGFTADGTPVRVPRG